VILRMTSVIAKPTIGSATFAPNSREKYCHNEGHDLPDQLAVTRSNFDTAVFEGRFAITSQDGDAKGSRTTRFEGETTPVRTESYNWEVASLVWTPDRPREWGLEA
jgi:hypothetical protein